MYKETFSFSFSFFFFNLSSRLLHTACEKNLTKVISTLSTTLTPECNLIDSDWGKKSAMKHKSVQKVYFWITDDEKPF